MSLTPLAILLHDTSHDLAIIDSCCHLLKCDSNNLTSEQHKLVDRLVQAKSDLYKKLDSYYEKYNI